MTALATVLLVITAAMAVADWVAVGRNIRWLEYVTKAGFMAGLILFGPHFILPTRPSESSSSSPLLSGWSATCS